MTDKAISPSAIFFKCENASTVLANFFNKPQYACQPKFFVTTPLPLGVGYAVVLAFGLAFALATVALVYLDQYVFRRTMNSEYFNTAGRSVRTGLTASVIVSQWTWAATLLQSSNVAFKYGVSGPLWYAAGATVQVVLFSTIAVLVKLRAPTAHTFLEIIRARWGKKAHLIFLVFALLTNILVSSMLVVAGSATVSALTGMNVNIASFLIPLGVILYTLAGGLKATFVASYFNTALILISLVLILFMVYVSPGDLGSTDIVYRNLETVTTKFQPVDGNLEGSYLTMFSREGFYFGLVNLVGNFGTVFIDQSYWQSAIAASPSASWKGYILGGLCWFAIPFSLATSLGLAAAALSLPITMTEADKGLVPPAAALHLMGNPGAVLIMLMLFVAVTSSGAAEQIAVSSVVSYDVYRTYVFPNCSGQRIIFISRMVILFFGLFMGVLGVVLQKIGLSLNFIYLAMGIFVGPAVIPVAFSISWGRASAKGAISGAILGLICGLSAWLIFGATFDDGFRDNLEKNEVMLAGNLVSLLSSGLICIIVSLFDPDDCDWSTTRAIPLIEDDPNAHIPFEDEEALELVLKKIGIIGAAITVVLFVLWPLLALPARVFTMGYFRFWVVLSFIWGIVSCGIMVFLPLFESRHGILVLLSFGKYRHGALAKAEEEHDDDFYIEER